MKAFKKIQPATRYCLLLLVFFCSGVTAQPDTKQKTFTKTYTLERNQKVNIDNSFGTILVKTWDKPSVKVDVDITVTNTKETGNTENLLNSITIDDTKTDELISFKTRIDQQAQAGFKGKNNAVYAINYTVYIPSKNDLALSCKFGVISLPDYAGNLQIMSQYGTLKAGKLSQVKQIHVQYGTLEIGTCTNGRLIVQYSSGKINSLSDAVQLTSDYSTVALGLTNELSKLNVAANFGELQVNVGKGFNGNFSFRSTYGDLKNNSTVELKSPETSGGGNSAVVVTGNNKNNVVVAGAGERVKNYTGKTGTGLAAVSVTSNFTKIKVSDATL